MKTSPLVLLCIASLFVFGAPSAAGDYSTPAHDTSYDVFIPIAKYLAKGDAESLSAWFAPMLEISIFGSTNDSSKNQAKQIMRSFFKTYAPRSFVINHQAGRENMKYVLGDLNAGGEHFSVTIFASRCNSDTFLIQQLRIDRIE